MYQPPINLTPYQRLRLLVAEASRLRQTNGDARSPDVSEIEDEIDAIRARIYSPDMAKAARQYEELTQAARAIHPEAITVPAEAE